MMIDPCLLAFSLREVDRRRRGLPPDAMFWPRPPAWCYSGVAILALRMAYSIML